MTKLLQGLKKFFTPNPQSGLEAYIISKNPTNAAEVDHYAREYDSGRFIWGRGFNMMDLIIKMEKSELGPKIAAWLVVAMVVYLVIAQ